MAATSSFLSRFLPLAKDVLVAIKNNKRLARWLVSLGIVLVIYWVTEAIVAWLAQPTFVQIMTMSPLAGKVAVAVEPVKRDTLAARITYTGNCQPYLDVTAQARVQGWLQGPRVNEGEYVKKGQVVTRLDKTQLGAMAAQAKADAEFWEAEYKRIERLFQANAVSQYDLDSARRQYEVATNKYREMSEVYSYTDILAPISGRIARRFVDPGNLVQPGVSLFRVTDNSRMRAQVKVAEKDMPKIRIGTEAVVRFPALPNPYNEFHAAVSAVFPEMEPVTQTTTVEILVDNPEEVIKPDMYAVVDLILSRREGVLSIPRRAVVDVEGKPTVFTTDGVVAYARPVTLGVESGDRVEALEGLKEGEMIIYQGNRGLVDGQQVNIVAM